MDVRLIVLLMFLVSCMPEAQVTRGNMDENNSTTSGSGGGSTSTVSLGWNYLGTASTSITINASNLNTSYIVGKKVEDYLATSSNFVNANYCMVSSYTIGGIKYELRNRIVPISYYDFTNRRTVRVLRVDFPDTTNSATFCSGSLLVANSSGNYAVDLTSPATYQVNPASLCPSCTNMLQASRVRIFRKETNLTELPLTLLSLATLSLQIDPNNTITDNSSSCSTSSCSARGFDCCLDNQCVRDGGVRPSARVTYSSQLQAAEAERLQNPLSFLHHPHLYYICGSRPSTTSGSNSGGNGADHDAELVQLRKDYACIQSIKAQSSLTPFHLELLTRPTTYTASTDCLTLPADSANDQYFQTVMKRLYRDCGCSKTTLSEMISSCPAYEYTVTTADSNGTALQIDCYTPPNTVETVPLQMTVAVNSRSAPHRFFDDTGVERPLNSLSTFTQEGEAFVYQDDGYTIPNQKEFSMNAILGQMAVTLDKALPAKSVTVEMDQVYLISTTSGYYTPCPSCSKDSWLNSFSPFPSTQYGIGLQSVGYSTQRDEVDFNTSSGNYEDTVFGRACWIPPTMIPFSHSLKTTVKAQRENRLQTQAALFNNGYQRDWFGFNKGALIGSFDGVTWFAVGKSRIVKSNSKKLFLAINAPFADLATPSIHTVNIQAFDGSTTGPQVDYDPSFHQTHSSQNEAGNCQKNHMCSTDTDCVTKLGWEYMCADVKDIKTQWPTFDTDGNEVAATSKTVTLDQILHQKKFPDSSTKRCVYRGSGSLCLRTAESLTNLNQKKTATCAPNFYCASTSAGVFNTKIARYGSRLEDIPLSRNHLIGKDANVLGRPLTYVASSDSGSLTSGIATTLSENMTNNHASGSSSTGLCLPGKSLPELANQVTMSNPFTQHLTADASKRTDYISQIGACNSTLFTDYRHSSCPVLGTDGNYEMFAASTIASGYHIRARNQNACGLESIYAGVSVAQSADNLSIYSPFKLIEAKTLNNQIITEPTLARDACLRRAGQVCHTDLDCSPNKLHGSQVDFFGVNYFGNLAEKNYYAESLVCGQTAAKPSPSSSTYDDYDMSLNRCCREVGLDITTYSSDEPTNVAGTLYDATTLGLKMSLAPGVTPSDAKRYSRLATVENLGAVSTRPILSAYQARDGGGNLVASTQSVSVMTPEQWKTLGEANSETCCGGGWIRKFSDGGNDWSQRDRMYVDVNNFKCLNSRSVLLTHPEDVLAQYGGVSPETLVDYDYGDYCKDGTNTKGSCAQYSFVDTLTETLPSANNYSASVAINTILPNYSSTNLDYFFKPRSADGDSSVIIDYNTTGTRRNITIQIPSYVTKTSFDDLFIATSPLPVQIVSSTGVPAALTCDYADLSAVTGPTVTDPGTCASGDCCYDFDTSTRVLKVVMDDAYGGFTTQKAGVLITVAAAGNGLISRSKPGSNTYYLKRLGKLELSGIPQISYEALYCNDNLNRIVPGIFTQSVTSRTNFTNSSFSFISGGTNYTSQFGLEQEPVFSQNDFKCCTPLGKTSTSAGKCCSGYGDAISGSSSVTCSLPSGSDLMVYFNRFVSNEGRGTDQPGGGLVDADFDTLTGEPKLTVTVNQKIAELGLAYCSSKKVRQGGAFGYYEPEPQGSDTTLNSRIYNIVDSTRDNGTNSNAGATVTTGYTAFMDGFRWNHHLYCND